MNLSVIYVKVKGAVLGQNAICLFEAGRKELKIIIEYVAITL
jgi:hypothetical protein